MQPRPSPAAMAASSAAEQARMLTAILLHHPALLHDVEEAYVGLALPPVLREPRVAVLSCPHGEEPLDSATLLAHLHHAGFDQAVAAVLTQAPQALPACAKRDAMPAEAEAGWWHFFGIMHRDRLEREVTLAREAFATVMDHANQSRLKALTQALEALNSDGQLGEAHSGGESAWH